MLGASPGRMNKYATKEIPFSKRIKYGTRTTLQRFGSKVFPRLEILRRLNRKHMASTATIQHFDLLIGGRLRSASNQNFFPSFNPSNGEICAYLADAGIEDARAAIDGARTAFDRGPWPRLSVQERGVYLQRIAQLIRDNAKELAELETADTGKTAKQTTFIDVPTCAVTFEYFSHIGELLKDQELSIDAPVHSILRREPMGVIAGIIPWNYPLIMAAWKLAPALMAGNTMVFKPSSLASVSVLKLAQLIQKAQLPAGVVNIFSTQSRAAATELVTSPDVDMLSFTGGTETGKELGRLAAASVKKTTLELGGKSPSIVFADCDLEAAVGGTMSAIFMNQGQMCTAGSRLILQDAIYDRFLEILVQKTKSLKIGDANHYDTDFGPLISDEHRHKVLAYIEQGIKEGARLVCGGKIPTDPALAKGYYLEPTIFTHVRSEMTIAQEEIFGPVLSVLRFSQFEEAIELANDTEFGLAACVWTKDLEKAHQVAQRLRCGTIWVNTYGGFYHQAPYGGYKKSGYGRELGVDGLLEFTQTKHVCTDQTPGGKSLVTSWF